MLTVTLVRSLAQTGPLQRLIFRQTRQDAKDDRRPTVQLHFHEAMGDGICDVFKVHGRAFQQAPNGDDC